jgi:hypothetical protein
MHCRVIETADGGWAFACGPRAPAVRTPPCLVCGARRASRQCDQVLGSGVTCDAWLCAQCAVHTGPNTDYCLTHAPPEAAALVARIRATAARLRRTSP